MAQICIDKTNFYYECHGIGEPLVLIAGYGCDHSFWNAMLKDLSAHFQVLIFDNRGIGQTEDFTTSFTLEILADDTIQLIKALDLKQPIILGQSMGGAIAQIIARKYAHDIEKLIILNSSAQINARTLMMLQSLLSIYQENVSFDTLIEASMPWFFSGDYLTFQHIVQYKQICQNNPFPPTPEFLSRQLDALHPFNSHAWVHELNMPTLVIASSDDIVCLPAESKDLANSIVNAHFTQIAGGHSSPIENPKQVIQAILHFQNSFHIQPALQAKR